MEKRGIVLGFIAFMLSYNCSLSDPTAYYNTDTLYFYQTDTLHTADTLYTTINDTIYDVVIDTVYGDADTVYVVIIDTVYQIDTVYVGDIDQDSTLYDVYVETGNVPPNCAQIFAIYQETTDSSHYELSQMCPYMVYGDENQIIAGDYIFKAWYIDNAGNMNSTQLYPFSIIGDMYVLIDGSNITLLSGD